MASQSCVILVPSSGPIEPECEKGLRALEAKGYPIRRVFGFSAIDFGRSVMASHALQSGYEELMWIDSDVGFDPRDVERLRSHALPLSCGLYSKKDRKSFACYFAPGTENVPFGVGGKLTEVQYAGFGFVHTRRTVYDRIRERFKVKDCNQRFGKPITPWFLPEVVPDGAGSWYLPEDYAFCHRARLCGVPIMADTTIRLSHVGKYAFTWEDIRATQERKSTVNVPLNPKPSPTPDDTDEPAVVEVPAELP
jgi:hypothetical protein